MDVRVPGMTDAARAPGRGEIGLEVALEAGLGVAGELVAPALTALGHAELAGCRDAGTQVRHMEALAEVRGLLAQVAAIQRYLGDNVAIADEAPGTQPLPTASARRRG